MPLSDGGGTLTLPSPTHAHRVNVSHAVRSLRRSISRSPSKFNLAARYHSESPSSSPQSPCRRYSPVFTPHNAQTQMSLRESPSASPQHPRFPTNSRTPSCSPLRSNVKLSLRSSRLSRSPPKLPSTPSRPRVSPKSPLKRALGSGSDSGNPAPVALDPDAPGQENKPTFSVPTSPLSRRCTHKPSRHSLHLDVSGTSHSMFKGTGGAAGPLSLSPPSGALKRSDANMDFGPDRTASPVAKRRSLHSVSTFANLQPDAQIFDAPTTPSPLNFDIHDDLDQEYQLAGTPAPFIRRDTQPSPTPGPSTGRRSSSLRKSTLQQRHGEKGSWGRRTGAQHLAQMSNEPSTPIFRSRPRLSADAFLPPPPRESPFSATGPLPPPSMHPLPQQQNPHPLSRSIKQSGSSGNFPGDTPMKFSDPPANTESPRKADPFTFSGGPRPATTDEPAEVAPQSYTPAAPPPLNRSGMFMSTGLVSKVNRDPDEDKRMVVPDTPCKKPSSASFATYPPLPGSRDRLGRSPSAAIFHSGPLDSGNDMFGNYGNVGRGLNLFHRVTRRPRRRASVMDLKTTSQNQSPVANDRDGQCTPDGLPPTPTKLFSTPAAGGNDNFGFQTPSANRFSPPTSASDLFARREPSGTCPSASPRPDLYMLI